ncbi:endonuclease/exonuclease/phosphatase family protein [Saccharicrinis aurantiacus]|uniref:endonuclease/exonuclease/phosphatase family protein n=1 Tax=Saccharicrinis aurantiacus TaxID=1849719 RepID=UPI002491D535|nr:endonuclease/exonuclease/phosphatase family protein [Saccharicrinis aurantiacus]
MTKDLIWELTKELRRIRCIFIFVALFICSNSLLLHSQQRNILFYNVENLFDVKNDSLKQDDEFLPNGVRHWSFSKYQQKLFNIAQVIFESDGFNLPMLVGMCEVENKAVLNDLIFKTGLSNVNYFPIHIESPDLRGIDVALLYKKDLFTIDSVEAIPVVFEAPARPTRDILHVFGVTNDSIGLHIYINHWPSRYGGVMQTHQKRIKAANVLAQSIQQVYKKDADAKFVVMGDFNDNPDDESLKDLVQKAELVNLSSSKNGSIKHKHAWYLFDQFLVSENLQSKSSFRIIDFPYLLEKDETNSGFKPKRTYLGYKYHGGYSDHLPIMLSLDF